MPESLPAIRPLKRLQRER